MPVIDKETVTAVCIDDFAIKKRENYGTIMIDIYTHRILDIIDSREYKDVMEWLKTYPNLSTVSRDGSITYHNAITEAHPNALQVSDRFHLLKNLTSYATEYLKKKLKAHILIPTVNQEGLNKKVVEPVNQADKNRKLTLKEKYDEIEKLLASGKSKTAICRSINMDVRAYDKLLAMKPDERSSLFQTKMMIIHEEKVRMKAERVKEVRELKKAGCSNREISRRTGLHTSTIRNYLDENFTPVHASYGRKKNGKLIPYLKEIDACLEKGKRSI